MFENNEDVLLEEVRVERAIIKVNDAAANTSAARGQLGAIPPDLVSVELFLEVEEIAKKLNNKLQELQKYKEEVTSQYIKN